MRLRIARRWSRSFVWRAAGVIALIVPVVPTAGGSHRTRTRPAAPESFSRRLRRQDRAGVRLEGAGHEDLDGPGARLDAREEPAAVRAPDLYGDARRLERGRHDGADDAVGRGGDHDEGPRSLAHDTPAFCAGDVSVRRRRARPGGERPGEELAGVREVGQAGELLRRAGGDHSAALVPALGAEVDDPVGALDDVEVVLDDDHGVALVDQPLQHLEQLVDVGEVQAGGGLVEDVERLAGGDLAELGGELDALGLAAGQRRRRLAELDVAEADLVERPEAPRDARDVGEELRPTPRRSSPAPRRCSCPCTGPRACRGCSACRGRPRRARTRRAGSASRS